VFYHEIWQVKEFTGLITYGLSQTQTTFYLFKYTLQHMHTNTHTHTHIYIYILFKKSKIYIKTFKTLLHVSITRSSSGTIYGSLLKL